MTQDKTQETFASGSVSRAVLRNALPAMAAMLMVMIYNIADTFFIGQTNDDLQVAAVSLATPVFLMFMSLGTLFGIGGTSVISRAMGEGRKDYARKVCAFCTWACIGVGAVMMTGLWLFMEPLLTLLGASADTWEPTATYMNIVVSCGIFSMLSNCYSNIIRAEGQPTVAMTGTLVGNLLNVILDPLLILTAGWGVAGAAIATVLGNAVAALYYLIYFWRGKSSLSIAIRDFTVQNHIAANVLAIGIPASLASLLMSVSQIVTNALMASYGDLAVAAYGVTGKIQMMVGMLAIGMGQGIQPLLGYCCGARDFKRFRACLNFSLVFATALCFTISLLLFLLAEPVCGLFLTEPTALSYCVSFNRIMLVTAWLFGAFYVLQNALQAMGAAGPSLIVSLCRQGVIYLPAVLLLGSLMGMTGLVWAQPVADVLSTLVVTLLLAHQMSQMAQPKFSHQNQHRFLS